VVAGGHAGLLALALSLGLVAWSGFASAAESPAAGKSLRLTSPEQTPRGLAPSDWASIRSAYQAGRDPIAQQAYLKAHQVNAEDRFGHSVAVSGDTVVVGAVFEGSSTTGVNSTPNEGASASGAAYVFVRSGTTWTQQAYLKAGQVNNDDWFGFSVAISGDTVVVGAHQEDSSTTGVNSTPDERADNAGAAYVFVRSGTNWTQQAYLKASNSEAFDQFGRSVAVSGDTVVVGAHWEDSSTTGVNSRPNESASDAGAAYVFVRGGTTWSQQAYLKASQASVNDYFGRTVAVSGDTVAVGAPWEDSSTTGINSTANEGATDSGAAFVFTRNGSTWSQQAYLKAGQVTIDDQFGHSVSVSGDTVVVGAPSENSGTTGVNGRPNVSADNSGAAYVFLRSGTTWSQQAYLKASQISANDNFGFQVAVAGDTVVVGARQEDSSTTGINGTPNEDANDAGAAYVLVRSGTSWTQQAFLKAGVVHPGDVFGSSVAVDGDTVVVGAHEEDSSTPGINSTPDELAPKAGAAFVFTGLGPRPFASVVTPAGTDWTTRELARPRRALASSHDGQRLVAAVHGDRLQVSADAGATWTPTASERAWSAVASSADGSRLTAAVANGPLFHSADAGGTWAEIAPARAWSGLAASADGLRLAAAVDFGPLYLSTNAGVDWTAVERSRSWKGIASSADGQMLAAVVEDGPLLVSTNAGVTWVPRAEPKAWTSIAASADGSVLVASVWDGLILVSSDSGLTWNRSSADRFWHSVSCSADGRRLIAAETLGRVYLSTDSGLNWTEHLENRDWAAVAWSGDGNRVVAAAREGPLFVTSTQLKPFRLAVPARAAPTSLRGFIHGIIAGAADPGGRQRRWTVESANPDLFAVPPALDDDGTLSFVPAGRPGLARVTLTAQDAGEPQVVEIELQGQEP
jgi:ribonuclease BN (tRNA processing enzyme)